MIFRYVRLRWTLLTRGFSDHLGLTERRVATALEGVGRGSARHVLIAPPGSGNIGDQAMVEAFLAAADRPVTVVVRAPDDFVFPADLAPSADIVALPGLFYGRSRSHTRSAVRPEGAAGRRRDGVDRRRRHHGRAFTCCAVRCAVPPSRQRAPGQGSTPPCSDSAGAARRLRRRRRALRRAGAAGVRLLLRDPASAARVRDAGDRRRGRDGRHRLHRRPA